MTIRNTQTPVLVLVDEEGETRGTQVPVLVLWGIGSVVQIPQVAVLALGRFPRRRTIGVTS